MRKGHPTLTREGILRAALAIVDREGLEAVSMRRLGEEVGVEAMSLYHHVEDKAAILDGIHEAVLQEMPPGRRSASWRSTLRRRGCALRSVLRGHPNAVPLFATRPAVTITSLKHLEQSLRTLREAGFPPRDALGALQALFAFVVGHVLATVSIGRGDSRPAYDHLAEEEFPRVREAARLLPTYDLEREFALGLDAMLAGLEMRRRRRAKQELTAS